MPVPKDLALENDDDDAVSFCSTSAAFPSDSDFNQASASNLAPAAAGVRWFHSAPQVPNASKLAPLALAGIASALERTAPPGSNSPSRGKSVFFVRGYMRRKELVLLVYPICLPACTTSESLNGPQPVCGSVEREVSSFKTCRSLREGVVCYKQFFQIGFYKCCSIPASSTRVLREYMFGVLVCGIEAYPSLASGLEEKATDAIVVSCALTET